MLSSCALLALSWASLGPSWGSLGALLDPPGALLWLSWAHRGAILPHLVAHLAQLMSSDGCLNSS